MRQISTGKACPSATKQKLIKNEAMVGDYAIGGTNQGRSRGSGIFGPNDGLRPRS